MSAGCYRVTMRDELGPFVPIIVAGDPDEAGEKARHLSQELYGADAALVLIGVQYRHEANSHRNDRTDRRPNRRLMAQQLRGER